MVNENIIKAIHFFVPAGERSNFVNRALEDALDQEARQRAIDSMNEFRKTVGLKMTDAQIRKAREYGRE